jgi:hypothetical protein
MPLDTDDAREGPVDTDAEDDHPADEAARPAAPDAEPSAGDDGQTAGPDASGSGRDVEVPMRVYKSVTVFSTLIAVVSVLGGFLLLDRATNRARLPAAEVDIPLAVAGLGAILLGAAVYAYSTRFRAAGMGTPKDDAGQGGDNG